MATIDNYKIKKTLGTGAFSKVKLAEDENGELIALKVMKKYPKNDKSKHWDLFYNEIKAMKNFKHPNILKLITYSEDAVAVKSDGSKVEVIYIALEYAEYGELFDFIAETGRFTEDEARFYFHQLIGAIEYLHKLGYAHRDVKPENLLVDTNYNLKLADFGFATKENFSLSRKGTFGYMSPQVIANEEYNCKEADLFSAAVLLFIMVTQHPPFLRAEKSDKYYKRIYEGNWDSFWSVHSDENLSESFIDFITKMFSVDPKNRLTISEIKSHPWYTGPVPTQREIYKRFSKRKISLDEYNDNKENQHKNEMKAKTKSSPKQNNKLYTQFYEVNDGDELLDVLVNYANKEEYDCVKSTEFFRVQIVAKEMAHEVCMIVNVLKKPSENKRCLEFVLLDGHQQIFEMIFKAFRNYLVSYFKSADMECDE